MHADFRLFNYFFCKPYQFVLRKIKYIQGFFYVCKANARRKLFDVYRVWYFS